VQDRQAAYETATIDIRDHGDSSHGTAPIIASMDTVIQKHAALVEQASASGNEHGVARRTDRATEAVGYGFFACKDCYTANAKQCAALSWLTRRLQGIEKFPDVGR
jgi:hypothetical protein